MEARLVAEPCDGSCSGLACKLLGPAPVLGTGPEKKPGLCANICRFLILLTVLFF